MKSRTQDTPRPKVLISRCIAFDHCRWDGDIVVSSVVEAMKPHVDFVTVCPECAVGLGIPRKPVRLVSINNTNHMIQYETGVDKTTAMNRFSETFLSKLSAIDGILLKERSPSCGLSNTKLFTGISETAPLSGKTSGLFTVQCRNRFPLLPTITEEILSDPLQREHFYTQIFTLARFRTQTSDMTIRSLTDFHAAHKLLLMSYHQTHMRAMGRLLACNQKEPVSAIRKEYQDLLCRALKKSPRRNSPANVLMHALGYFSQTITPDEKLFFLGLFEQYRNRKIPLSACNAAITAWIIRFDEPYLKQQYFFTPYPQVLISLTDSVRQVP